MTSYKKTRIVAVGGQGKTKKLLLGADNPVVIQTMWKQGILGVLNDQGALFLLQKEIEKLEKLGCGILRFAVPDMDSAEALLKIAEVSTMPLVADIHFDHKLALRCLDGEVAKIRINPGNIGSEEKRKAVLEKAAEKNVPIRIGLNAGSLPTDLAQAVLDGSLSRATALAQAAIRELEIFDKYNFKNVLISLKASDVDETIMANETLATLCDFPLHIGVTEAGPLIAGVVKNTIACTHLLKKGIGSTIRVSLSASAENEVITAKEILREAGMLSGVQIISCPRCGRNGFDVIGFVERWQPELYALNKDATIAVMGCAVNGPGEAKHADIGITGAGDTVLIFKKGKVIHTVSAQNADDIFRKELLSL